MQAQLGITPNFLRVLANSPKALEGFLGLYALPAASRSTRRRKSGSRWPLPESNACQYCVSAHTAIGRHAGLTNDEIH